MKFVEFLNGKDVETYFYEKIQDCGQYNELPRELKNCNCCERHKINFPILGKKIESSKTTKSSLDEDCKCPCRHIARHICREWDIINQVEEILTDDSEYLEEEDSVGSLEDFIVPDKGFKKKERKSLDKALNKFRGKKNLRR